MKTILACRNVALGKEAEETLKKDGHDVEFRELDISNRSSIAKFAELLSNDYEKIDILVNNAAVAFKANDPTPFVQQARPTLETNFFGTLYVTELLLPLLRKSPQPRLVNVASESGHLRIIKDLSVRDRFTDENLSVNELVNLVNSFLTDVENERHTEAGWPNTCYGFSKLSVIALTNILAKQEPSILINSCCPGYCDTDMTSHKGPKSAADGAKTPVFLATLPSSATITGKFFSEEKEITW